MMFKKKLLSKGILAAMMLCTIFANTPMAKAQEEETKEGVEPRGFQYAQPKLIVDKPSIDIGDVITTKVTGLSFDKIGAGVDSSEHFSRLRYSTFTRSGFWDGFVSNMLEFEGLQLGNVVTRDADGNIQDATVEVEVSFNKDPSSEVPTNRVDTIYSLETVHKGEEYSLTITKQQMIDYAASKGYTLDNVGWISWTYRLANGKQIAAMDVEDTILQTKFLEGQKLFKPIDTYARTNVYVQSFGNHYLDPSGGDAAYMVQEVQRFRTAKIAIKTDKTTYLPGDEIEATITITNPSTYDNKFVYVGIRDDAQALEMLEENKDNDTIPRTEWHVNDNNEWVAALAKVDGTTKATTTNWETLKPNETHTIVQKFKVKDDYAGEEINLQDFLYNYYSYDLQTTGETTLRLKDYDVAFDTDGGSAIAPQKVFFNKSVLQPTNPTKEGYTFKGWFKEKAYTTAWDFTANKINANTTIYAKWEKIKAEADVYTVRFDFMGGSFKGETDPEFSASIFSDSSRLIRAYPYDTYVTKEGYSFAGWYTSKNYTKKWNFAEDQVNSSMILYAKWIKEETPEEKPATPENPTKPENPNADKTDSVQTGDTANQNLLFAMMIGGLAMMGIVIVLNKKKKLAQR